MEFTIIQKDLAGKLPSPSTASQNRALRALDSQQVSRLFERR